jgi:uncharacterized membrane protein
LARSKKPSEKTDGERPRLGPLWSTRRAAGRLFVSVGFGAIAVALFAPTNVAWWVQAVVGWDVAAGILCALTWRIIVRANAARTRARAAIDDPGGMAVFIIALVSSLFSLFAGAYVLRWARAFPHNQALVWSALAIVGVMLAWILTHTAYALRYVRLYYAKSGPGGLQFPGPDPPADIDFAYFAFTIGMTFQASDVLITSSRVRAVVLSHAILAFVYNTIILAVALNLAMGLLG